MSKALVVDYARCHGCRECETACAMIGEMNLGASAARITPVTWELEGRGVPVICQHCQDAPCMVACPKGAIYREREGNRILVNHDRCIGCRMCMTACPFGAMGFDPKLKRVIKCDLCDGDPLCASLCSYGALQYEDVNDQCVRKKMDAALKLKELLQGEKGVGGAVDVKQ